MAHKGLYLCALFCIFILSAPEPEPKLNMTPSQSRWLVQETDIEFIESKIADARERIGELLSIEEIFTQDSRGVRETFSRQQIRENRTLAAELYEDIEQYEERISALRAEEQAMAPAA